MTNKKVNKLSKNVDVRSVKRFTIPISSLVLSLLEDSPNIRSLPSVCFCLLTLYFMLHFNIYNLFKSNYP